mmetsp:Transcript_10000/g.15148  ORF Transcript_10000/g.15148 Transcript_10000/m.15148 type:complete len:388 (-) Transcript_10000:91-1254(-)
MQSQNQNSEGKTLSYSDMLLVLQILETGSMNEAVRLNLSDKKKIKDLFLVVIRSIEIPKNKTLISSLIQFISNLCYGQGRLRQMLAREDKKEFFQTLKAIFDNVKTEVVYKEDDDEEDQENKDPKRKQKFEEKETADRSLLRQSLYSFVANLCNDKTLRLSFANDSEGILKQIIADFKQDVKEKKFDWFDMVTKELAIFINVSIESPAQATLFNEGLIDIMEELVIACKTSEPLQKQILERVFNLLSKIFRHSEAPAAAAEKRHLVFKAVLYMNKEFGEELQLNALRTFHALCKVPDFKDICTDTHKFPAATFNGYVKEIIALFDASVKSENWANLINAQSSMVGFVTAFPERLQDFDSIIVTLIMVVKEKTEVVRKNAAILLAKLA